MAKRSHRRPARYENQSGCMWGFISILDFRSRSTRKLLSDRRRWSRHADGSGNTSNKFEVLANCNEDCQSTIGGEENTAATAGVRKPSVKRLMEEEMSSEHDSNKEITNAEVQQKQLDNGSNLTKSQKRKKKNAKKSGNLKCHDLNAARTSDSQHSCNQNSVQQSISNLNVDAIVKEFCSQIHQESLSCAEHDLNGEFEMKSNNEHSGFEEKLCDAVKVFMNQKFGSEEKLEENGTFQHPKELIDALGILNSDKELFLQLLKDPNSLLLKSSQNLKDTGEENDENSKSNRELCKFEKTDPINRKKHNFFRRKAKSEEKISLKGDEDSEASNRIVILKPGPAGLQNSETETSLMGSHYIIKNKSPSERAASQFSFSEIKRRLKHAMGKEHQGISSDVMLDQYPNEHQIQRDCGKAVGGENIGRNSPSKDHFFMERIVKPSSGLRKKDKASQLKESEISMQNDSKQRVSNIYMEAKKHLSEMLSNGDEEENTSSRLIPKSLGRILSLPEYNFSPIDSPAREQERNMVTAQTRLSISEKFEGANENTWPLGEENNCIHPGSLIQSVEAQTCISGDDSNDKSQALSSNPSISEDVVHEDEKEIVICIKDEINFEGNVEIVKTTDAEPEEEINVMDASSEPVSSFITRDVQIGETSETSDGEGHSEELKEDVYEENQPLSSPLASPSSSSVAQKVEHPENAIDVPDRASPISVLEPLFTEDDFSPASTPYQSVELPIQPLRIQFEEHESSNTDEGIHRKTRVDGKESILEYVKAVLQAPGLNWDELYIRSLSSDQLLKSTLFDEIEFFSNQLCHDPKLLFDCINEVLMEVYGHHFGCWHWVSFVKPSIRPVPNMKNAIQEVWEGICWHLLPQPLPRTLDQIVGKDMTRSGKWMDLRFDVETIGGEMGEVILAELMEDTIFNCVNEVPGNGYPVVPAELKETESSIDL